MSKNSGVDPEFLQAALDHLTRPKGFGQRKDMERLVLEALARYQGLKSNSLLWSDVREELKDIERAAAELLKRLRRASAFSISRLGTSTRLRPFFRKAYDANGRPVQSRGSWDDAYESMAPAEASSYGSWRSSHTQPLQKLENCTFRPADPGASPSPAIRSVNSSGIAIGFLKPPAERDQSPNGAAPRSGTFMSSLGWSARWPRARQASQPELSKRYCARLPVG